MKVFLDSNIIFSICWSGKEKSRSFLLYELQKREFFRIFVSQLVHSEDVRAEGLEKSVSSLNPLQLFLLKSARHNRTRPLPYGVLDFLCG